MKSRVRLTLLLLATVACFLYVLGPTFDLHRFLSDEISQLLDVHTQGSLQDRCYSYFSELARVAPAKASKSRNLSQKQISNHLDHLRIFSHCFVENNLDLNRQLRTLEQFLLPIFSGNPPRTSFPVNWTSPPSEVLYWRRHLDHLSGRGIVISVGNNDAHSASRLLRVLNHLKNTLPIQFVHVGDLSETSKEMLRKAATNSGLDVFEQEIEFIDASPALKSAHKTIFKGYNNKWFAALFNTFDEMILMDADAVPFVDPSHFFQLQGYIDTGAYFFRDRELLETLTQMQVNFFQSLIPHDQKAFPFRVDTTKLGNNLFAYNSKHVVESGLIVMKRPTHISGLLVSMSLQYWYQSGKIVYGDKDLFWLGQLISGNSEYHLNKNAAGAIGELEDGNTLCATQLAHFDDSLRLLWTNGGLSKCKKNTWIADYFKYPNLRKTFKSIGDLRQSYSKEIVISEAVLPASMQHINGNRRHGLHSNFNKRYNRGCGGVYYCATLDDGGTLLEFSEKEKEAFNEIVRVWNYG